MLKLSRNNLLCFAWILRTAHDHAVRCVELNVDIGQWSCQLFDDLQEGRDTHESCINTVLMKAGLYCLTWVRDNRSKLSSSQLAMTDFGDSRTIEQALLASNPKKPDLLAASPAFAGPGTRPYRIVLLKWSESKFSVHTQFLDDLGGMCNGYYHINAAGHQNGTKVYGEAMQNWHEKVAMELKYRGQACYDFTPIG